MAWNEGKICTIIKDSFKKQGNYAYKIPDPTGDFSATIKRPFDIIGSYKGKPLIIEAKYMKELKSFNLKKVEDHQIQGIQDYTNTLDSYYAYIVLGVYVKRGDVRLYFFPFEDIKKRRLEGTNYMKKELESLRYYAVIKDLVIEPIFLV